jgi:hypothetical protein
LQGDIPKFGSPERFGAFSLDAIAKVWSWGKTVIIRSAHRVILLGHSSKWATRPLRKIVSLPEIDILVTDGPPERAHEAVRRFGG